MMFRKWLDKVFGRSSDATRAAEAEAEATIERQRTDRAFGRVMGAGLDYGSTPPDPQTPADRRPYDRG
jgi:hypothetical protein